MNFLSASLSYISFLKRFHIEKTQNELLRAGSFQGFYIINASIAFSPHVLLYIVPQQALQWRTFSPCNSCFH